MTDGERMPSKRFRVTIIRDGSMCFIPVPFDPKPDFGKIRAPVTVTLNGYNYRSTISSMGGKLLVPLRRSNREAAGLDGSETLEVTLALDEEERRIEPPADLAAALEREPRAHARWRELSFSHKREHVEAVEAAKRPETRERRIASAVAMLAAMAPKTGRP
jgi:hypothetical protein